MSSSTTAAGRRIVGRRPVSSGPGSLALGAALVLLAFLLVGAVATRQGGNGVHVTVQGKGVRLRRAHRLVGDALRAARVIPRDGAVLSAVSHRQLDRPGAPAYVLVDGRAATDVTVLKSGEEVRVVDGTDAVEPIDHRRVPAQPAGLPPVELRLWHLGGPGIDEVDVGRWSGEVARRVSLVPSGLAQPESAMVVALTFDDGPNPAATPQVLQILREEGIKATFCIYGQKATIRPELLRAEVADGHTMCDHTVHHIIHLEARPHSQIVDEIDQDADFIHDTTGQDAVFYRAPGGTLSPDVIEVAHQRSLRVLGWTVDPHDYERPPPELIRQRVLAEVGPGAIILLHDGGGDRSYTVAALRPLIDELKARGYRFVTP